MGRQIRGLAASTEVTHVVFSNCYRDYAQVNARLLAELPNLNMTMLAGIDDYREIAQPAVASCPEAIEPAVGLRLTLRPSGRKPRACI